LSKRRKKKVKVKLDLRVYKNLTEAEDYNRRFAEQGGRCALCGRVPKGIRRLNRDHNHISLKNRALLCFPCNKYVIGALEKFKIRLDAIINYFKKYDPVKYREEFDGESAKN
jgi:recombination endonuclease VII